MQNDEPRPDDPFIDRYMSGATGEEREEALANLEGLLSILIQIDERLAWEAHKNDSRESDSCDRVESGIQPNI